MAGDWIKMRTRLHEDPAVEQLVELTGLDSFAVIGRLHRLWSWADEQLRDGYARALHPVRIDGRVAHNGFARALEQVGWLVITDDGVRFPRWNTHNSKSAKQRALARDRMKRHRDARSVTAASPEKSRRLTDLKTKTLKETELTTTTDPAQVAAAARALGASRRSASQVGQCVSPEQWNAAVAKMNGRTVAKPFAYILEILRDQGIIKWDSE